MIICKSASEIRLMEEAGKIVAEVLLKIEEMLEPGITSGDIDAISISYTHIIYGIWGRWIGNIINHYSRPSTKQVGIISGY